MLTISLSVNRRLHIAQAPFLCIWQPWSHILWLHSCLSGTDIHWSTESIANSQSINRRLHRPPFLWSGLGPAGIHSLGRATIPPSTVSHNKTSAHCAHQCSAATHDGIQHSARAVLLQSGAAPFYNLVGSPGTKIGPAVCSQGCTSTPFPLRKDNEIITLLLHCFKPNPHF